MEIDPRVVSYSIMVVVVGGGAWAIRRVVANLANKSEAPEVTPLDAAVQAGDLEKASQLALDAGDWDRGAELLLQLGKTLEAARAFRSGKHWDRAGELFERAGDFAAAAHCFRRASNLQGLLRALVATEEWTAAAEAAEQLGDKAKAVELWLKAEAPERAVRLLHKLGQVVRAAMLEGAIAEAAGDWAKAAECWVLGQDLHRALAAYEKAGDGRGAGRMLAALGLTDQAAQKFAETGLHAEAAPLFEGLGAYRQAAMSYQRAGHSERAIHCLSLAGDKLAVVKLRMATGQTDEALRVALTAESTEATYVELYTMAAEIQETKGDLSGVGRTLAALMQAPIPSIDRVAFGRKAVDALIIAGELSRARTVLERLRPLSAPGSELEAWLQTAASQLPTAALPPRNPPTIAARLTPTPVTRDAAAIAAESTEHISETTLDFPGREDPNDPDWPVGVPAALSNRYARLERVGQGGNGVVFRATDKLLGRQVVLKFMLEGAMPTDMARKYFLREVQLAAALNHPNIVHIYDMGETDGVPWYCMEYVDGRPLTSYLQHGIPVADRRWLVNILEQLSDALDHAHGQGMVHRDIKPDNVLVDRENKVKLLDFGLARVLNDGFGENSVLAGTPYYMAPEQLDGSQVDHRADIYALGVVLFRSLTGYLPFVEGNVFVAHAVEPVPDPCRFNPALPLEATPIVQRAMAKKPSERYSTCKSMADDVRKMFLI